VWQTHLLTLVLLPPLPCCPCCARLYKATGNETYLTVAYNQYKLGGGRWELSPYVNWCGGAGGWVGWLAGWVAGWAAEGTAQWTTGVQVDGRAAS